MKKLLYLFLIMAVSLPFAACDDVTTEDVNPELIIADSEVILGPETQEYTMQIHSNTDWVMISKTANILSVTPTSGTGDAEVKYTIDAYKGVDARDEIITLKTKGTKFVVTAIMKIRQTPLPEVMFNATSQNVPFTEGTYTIRVISNTEWQVSDKSANVSVNPSSGKGNADITYTVAANEGETRVETITVSAVKAPDAKATFTINQEAKPRAELSIDKTTDNTDFASKSYTINVTSNAPWTTTPSEGVVVAPSEGMGNATVVVTIADNETSITAVRTVVFSTDLEPRPTATFTVNQSVPSLVYGGVTYKIGKMGDGRWWMVESLRYLPTGVTAESDPLVHAKIWYPCTLVAPFVAITDPAEVAKLGYLYNTAAFFGVSELTEANYKSFEGAQGMCPNGWHLPSETEAQAMLDAHDAGNSATGIANLEAAGFTTQFTGFRNRANHLEATKGSYSSLTYLLLSTGNSYTIKETTGAITCNNRAMMYTNTASMKRVTVANATNYGGSSVRCIKNAN